MEVVLLMLPFIALLACPLMMVGCVFAMRKMGGATSPVSAAQGAAQPVPARVAVLQGQLLAIQAALVTLEATAPPCPHAVPEDARRPISTLSGAAHAARQSA